MGSRLVHEPEVTAAPGSSEDAARGQQKIFDIARGGVGRRRGGPHAVVLSEAELNGFLSQNLVEVAKMPITVRAVRLAGDGIAEFKALVALRDVLSASPIASLVPSAWLERQVWLHLTARANLEVGATRTQRRYLRFDVQRFAIGRQPLPRFFRWLLPSPGLQGLLRWRMPDSVESITIESGTVAIKTSS
ncbi:MAG: hypothetical protein DMD87_12350 [Candidatus Rokuibacteriota bacterium]|nr:MAG: hypothetical protein DMD87_12350 [Candidatus Rokubacteria bacterium]